MGQTSKGIGSGYGAASGQSNISLKEVFEWSTTNPNASRTLGEEVWKNVKANWMKTAGTLIGLQVGSTLVKRIGLWRQLQKLNRTVGTQDLVSFS